MGGGDWEEEEKSRWPAGPGMALASKEEGDKEKLEKEEVEGLEQQRGGFHERTISGSGSKRRGRATTFDQMLGSDGRLLRRAS